MATSEPNTGSISKEQTALLCQLCENEPKIKWKCLQCSLMMCHRCREKVHSKFKSAEIHKIIDLKDVGKLRYDEEVDFAQFKCDEHSGQPCCLFCEGCKIMICPSCVAGIHKKHDLVEMQVEIQRKVENVQNRIKLNESKLKKLQDGETKLRGIYTTEQEYYKNMDAKISEQEKHILNILQNHTRSLKDELNEKWIVIDHSVSGEIKKVIESGTKLEAQNKTLLEILHSNDPVKIFACSASSVKIGITNFNFKSMPVFVPNKQHEIDLKYGFLKQMSLNDKLLSQYFNF